MSLNKYLPHDFKYASIPQDLKADLGDMDAFINPRRQVRLDQWGVIAEPYPLGAASASTNIVSQTLYGSLVGFKKGDTISNVLVFATTVGTVSSVLAGVYDQSGNLLASSADFHASWAQQLNIIPMSTPYVVPADEALYLALDVTWSVQPKVVTGLAFTSPKIGSGPIDFVSEAAQATLPNPATLTASGIGKIWMAAT